MKNLFKAKTFRILEIFVVIMIILTFVSRMAYAQKLPRVSVGDYIMQRISHIVDVDGTVKAEKSIPVVVQDGLRINDVKIKSGDTVKKGDIILSLDNKYLDEMIKKEENKLNYQISSSRKAYEEIGKKPQFLPEGMRIVDIYVKVGDTVTEGQKLMNVDVNYLNEYINNLQSEVDENIVMRDKAAENDDDSVDMLDKKIEDIKSKIDKYQRFVDNDGVVFSDKNGVITDINLSVGSLTSNEAALLVSESPTLNSELAELQNNISEMKSIKEKNGLIESPYDGTVSEVFVKSGDFTTTGAAFIFSDGSEGFTFSAYVSENEGKYLTADNDVSLTIGNRKINGAKIKKISKENENMKIDIFLEETDLIDGLIGTLHYTVYSPDSCVCLERSSVNFEKDSKTEGYIYIVSETDGFLGKEYIVKRQRVSIIDSNNKYYGVSQFYIDANEDIVLYSSKNLSDGEKVRVL